MTITLIVLFITIALFIWGRIRSDIVALSALVVLILTEYSLPQRHWPDSRRRLSS